VQIDNAFFAGSPFSASKVQECDRNFRIGGRSTHARSIHRRGTTRASAAAMMLKTGLALVALSCAACGPLPKVVAQFGDATAAGAKTLAAAPGVGHAICLDRVQAAFVVERLKQHKWNLDPPWSEYYDKKGKAHCDAIAAGDDVVQKALAVLKGYGEALAHVASAGSYDGTNFKDAGDGLKNLLTAVGGEPPYAAAFAPVGGAMDTLVGWLMQAWATSDLKTAIPKAAPAARAMLQALDNYVAALQQEFAKAQSARRQILDGVDVAMQKTPDDAVAIVAFSRHIDETERRLQRTEQLLEDYRGALRDLESAQESLEKAAKADDPKPDLGSVLAAVSTAATHLVAIEDALKGGK
jgi:hypothetical protein